VGGALYFNSGSGAMKIWTGSAWVAAYVSGSGFATTANNLSDLASASAARTNLGLGTAATQASTAFAAAVHTHANVIAGGAAGFMSGTDKTKLDGLGASSGRVLLGSITVGASNLTLTGISSVYRALAVEFSNLSWDASATGVRIAFSNSNGSAYGAAVNTLGNMGSANVAWGSLLIEGLQIPRTSSSNIFVQVLGHIPATATVVTSIQAGLPDSATLGPVNAIKITGDSGGVSLIDSGKIEVWGIL
jgi:hypothetical protein